jgi:hypothetical protein
MGLLRTYRFIDKDPIRDQLWDILKEVGLEKKLNLVAELAGLHKSTPKNLFHGNTKKPQNATAEAIGRAAGWERTWAKTRELNLEEELEFARAWNKREAVKREKAREAAPPRKKKRA